MRSLTGKLALALLALFAIVGGLFILTTEHMLTDERLAELGTWMALSAIAFALASAMIVFMLLTRRMRKLVFQLDEFRASDFTRPMRFPGADMKGDEIQRLAATLEAISDRLTQQLADISTNDARRRELLANISHDLRTPLSSMQGYLETLLLKHGSLTREEERSYLEIAARHTERLGRLIGDLFQLTKLEANEVRINPEPFSIAELAHDVMQKFSLSAEQRSLELAVDVPHDLPSVDGDIALIERVLENLIENAMRHTPPRGTIRVTGRHDSAAGRAHVCISDTGKGIPKEQIAKVFDRYYTVSRSESGETGSTGLGLAITRHVVSLHGGQITVSSELGVGTTFCFDLPTSRRKGTNPG